MALIETLQATPEQTLPAGAEERKRRSRIAEALITQGMQTSPVQHWTQGAARLMQALVGGSMSGEIARDANAEQQQTRDLLMNLPGLTSSAPAATSPQPQPAAPVSPQANVSKTGMFDPGDTEMQAGLMTPVQYQPDVLDAAKRNNLDPMMLAKQLKQESRFNPNTVSPKGALGISQFMPATAAERGVNPLDPQSSIQGGADYLASLKQQFNGDDRLALMAYNWGPGNVQKWLASGGDPNRIPAETRDYLARIMGGQQSPQQPATPQPVQVAQAGSGVDPQMQATIRAMMANPQTRQMAMQLYGKFLTPPSYGFQTLPDGTVVRTNPRDGSITPVMSAPKNPTYGVISKDQYGNEQYGWIDPSKMKTTPNAAPAPAPQSAAQPTEGVNAQPQAASVPPPPPGVDPKQWRKEQTKMLVTKQASEGQRQKYADVVTNDIDRMMGIIDKSPNMTTGAVGNILQNVPGTNAHNAAALAETIRSNVGFDRLQEMRNASPTGGALGQVSDAENKLLASTLGNLALSQTKEQLQDNLRRVKNIYLDIIHGKGNGPEREKLTYQNEGKTTGPQVGHVEDGYRFKGGDPSKPDSWEKVQ